eukprot:TRINITY_DN1647_c0_g1_i2.p1 TRINITY_DN1647_c0_g1~~TRINITY_DN1647_c0_g1_i2.p1  ORF type:complete len:418 (-),score=82.67 TRINITY_DN1647_c0_g1_i2:310-1563(-)
MSSSASPSTISTATHLCASGTAAAISAIAVQPLDVLKTRLQVHKVHRASPIPIRHMSVAGSLNKIFQTEGVKGLYRGVGPTLVSVVPSISIYFTLYSEIKRQFGCTRANTPKDMALQSASAGLASSLTALVTNPLWLAKARLQTQMRTGGPPKYTNTFNTLQSVVREEGYRGLWKGLTASFLASSQAMVQLPLYEKLKSHMCTTNSGNPKKSTACYLAAAAISASLSSALTYPSEVVRARLQVQGTLPGLPCSYTGIFHALRTIFAEEGMRGLYRGMGTNLIRMTPSHAISFSAYEFLLRKMTAIRKAYYEEEEPVKTDLDPLGGFRLFRDLRYANPSFVYNPYANNPTSTYNLGSAYCAYLYSPFSAHSHSQILPFTSIPTTAPMMMEREDDDSSRRGIGQYYLAAAKRQWCEYFW